MALRRCTIGIYLRINILVLGASDKGGVSIYVSNLIKDIHDYSFYLPSKNNDSKKTMLKLYPQATIFMFDQNYTFLSLYKKAIELDIYIKKFQIDIIHAHVLRFGLLASIYKKFINQDIKILYTGHGSRFTQKTKKYEQYLFKNMEIFVNKTSNHVVFIRELEYQTSLKLSLLSKDKATIIKTQMEPDTYNKNNFSFRKKYDIKTNNIVAMIGSVYDIKNPFLFCDIAKKTLDDQHNTTFIWIGDGPQLEHMKNYIIANKMENYIKFIGPIEYQNMKAAWDEIDVLLLTSKIEIFPLILLEAYQYKTIVLTSNFSGVQEFVKNNITGYIFDMNHANTAYDQLKNIFTDTSSRQKIVDTAYQYYVNNYSSIDKMQNAYKIIYEEMT